VIDDLLKAHAPRVLGRLVRRYGDFDTCEDAVQEALLAAAQQWPVEGVPAVPHGWLYTVASRRLIELWRNESARRRRELTVALQDVETEIADHDDTLSLFLLCCHPSLTPVSQVALTLRAVGGLSTAEIARGLLVPEATVAQRISRAKQKIKDSNAPFTKDPANLPAVRHVLYLIFTEGSTASAGETLHRVDLSAEAIRLTRQLHAIRQGQSDGHDDGQNGGEKKGGQNGGQNDGETAGLLALMLLTDARRPARTGPDGRLIPLDEQDRTRWDRSAIAEGTSLLTAALTGTPIGPYQLQAAIAAVHDEAPSTEQTDWPQILQLYDLLRVAAPGPMVTLNRLVALAMVDGPEAALAQLPAAGPRVAAVRAHLLERAGRLGEARAEYLKAARETLSRPEQRYLEAKADQIARA
jgi:RNA polymerase sigma factor (sigma-70 family)